MSSTDEIILDLTESPRQFALSSSADNTPAEEHSEVEVEPEPTDAISVALCEAQDEEDLCEDDCEIDLEATAAADALLLDGEEGVSEDHDYDPDAVESEHVCDNSDCECPAVSNDSYESDEDVEELPEHHDECIALAKQFHELAVATLPVATSEADAICALAEVLMDNYGAVAE